MRGETSQFKSDPTKESDKEFGDKISLKKLSELVQNARESIRMKLVEMFSLTDDEIESYIEGIEQGAVLGQQASQSLRQSLERSIINPPEKTYEHSDPKHTLVTLAHERRIKFFKGKINPFSMHSPHRIKERFEDSFEPTEAYKSYSGKYYTERVKIPESELILEERVINDETGAYSILSVADPITKRIINFGDLLPNDIFFVPQKLQKNHKDKNHTSKPLTEYEGTNEIQGEGDKFHFSSLYIEDKPDKAFMKEVAYGNLTRKGGILTLLHEIGHSWEKEYHKPYGRQEFEDWMLQVRARARILNNDKHRNNPEMLQIIRSDLAEMGVVIDENNDLPTITNKLDNILKNIDTVTTSRSKFASGLKIGLEISRKKDVKVTGEELPRLVEDYVRDERMAWAHAIKILRFFRQRGIDLEPKLKTVKDIEEYTYGNLSTYDKTVGEYVAPNPDVRTFVRPHKQPPETAEKNKKSV